MRHFYSKIKGWFDYEDIYKSMVESASNEAHFVEIGVYQGKSAAYMAVEIINSGKKIKFDCIDPWDGRAEPGHGYKDNSFENFMSKLSPVTGYFNPIIGSSPDISKIYADESLDFVWIDAIHLYAQVKEDIIAWLPKIKKGGYIGGHDYSVGHENGVDKAVMEILPAHTVYKGELVDSWLYHNV